MDWREQNRIERAAQEKLVAGDKLYRIFDRYWRNAVVVEITKVTKTQLVLNDGSRLNRETLRKIGAGRYEQNHYHVIVPHTTENVARDRADFARAELSVFLEKRLDTRRMNDSELAALQSVIEQHEARQAAEKAAYEAERAAREARWSDARGDSLPKTLPAFVEESRAADQD